MTDLKGGSGTRSPVAKASPPIFARWSRTFLVHLAATSNITAAARKAKVSTTTAYEARRNDSEFARRWQSALLEGYEHLELELLQRLRSGEVKPKAGAARGVRSFDNGTAFRLLSLHRETVAKQRAVQDDEDEEAILASIDAKLDMMRQRQLEALESEAPDDGAE